MFTDPATDPVTTPPQIHLQAKAWRIDLDAARTARGIAADADATLDLWVVEAPWAHGFWHSYAISLIHLRPMPDRRETTFYLDGATHELWVQALDPDGKRQRLIDGGSWTECPPLRPMNFAAQFVEPDDAAARTRVEAAVQAICEGRLSPDTDYMRHWMHLFGDNMVKGDKGCAGETRIITQRPGEELVEIVIPAVGSKLR